MTMEREASELRDREELFASTELPSNSVGGVKPNGNKVAFTKLSLFATTPTKAHVSDSGFDLYASEEVIIEPGESAIIPTGISVQLPPGMEAQVRPKSGITSKTKLRVQLGTIDNGYTGDVGVMVDNISFDPFSPETQYVTQLDGDTRRAEEVHGDIAYRIRRGDKIAQLVVQYLPHVHGLGIFGKLDARERGNNGYGSTGVR